MMGYPYFLGLSFKIFHRQILLLSCLIVYFCCFDSIGLSSDLRAFKKRISKHNVCPDGFVHAEFSLTTACRLNLILCIQRYVAFTFMLNIRQIFDIRNNAGSFASCKGEYPVCFPCVFPAVYFFMGRKI